jgi:hypothetical protein
VGARWCEPGQRWHLLLPPDATVVELPGTPWRRRRILADVSALPAGTMVALVDDAPMSRPRGRRFARAARISIDREYLALPRLASAVCLVEEAPATTGWASRSVLTVPPGISRLHATVDAGVRVLRRRPALLGALAPGHIVLGRRT